MDYNMDKNINLEENNIINAVLTQWGGFCNICGAKRSLDNIKIVRKTNELVVLHINCSSCKNGHFISFNYNSAGFTMQQYSTDLQESELVKLSESPITMDDLLDTHIALENVTNTTELLSLLK